MVRVIGEGVGMGMGGGVRVMNWDGWGRKVGEGLRVGVNRVGVGGGDGW